MAASLAILAAGRVVQEPAALDQFMPPRCDCMNVGFRRNPLFRYNRSVKTLFALISLIIRQLPS